MDHDDEDLINDDGDDSDETEGDFNLTVVDGLNASDVVRVVGVGGVATGIALYVLSFLTFVGNAMVLHAIRTEKRLQTVSQSVSEEEEGIFACLVCISPKPSFARDPITANRRFTFELPTSKLICLKEFVNGICWRAAEAGSKPVAIT